MGCFYYYAARLRYTHSLLAFQLCIICRYALKQTEPLAKETNILFMDVYTELLSFRVYNLFIVTFLT
jgi:hypothetical protein